MWQLSRMDGLYTTLQGGACVVTFSVTWRRRIWRNRRFIFHSRSIGGGSNYKHSTGHLSPSMRCFGFIHHKSRSLPRVSKFFQSLWRDCCYWNGAGSLYSEGCSWSLYSLNLWGAQKIVKLILAGTLYQPPILSHYFSPKTRAWYTSTRWNTIAWLPKVFSWVIQRTKALGPLCPYCIIVGCTTPLNYKDREAEESSSNGEGDKLHLQSSW